MRPPRSTGSRQGLEGTLSGVLLEEAHRLRSTATLSAKGTMKIG